MADNFPGWYHAALKSAAEYARAAYTDQIRANKGKPLKQFYPPEITLALCAAAGAMDESECKRLMGIGRAGAWSLV